MKVSLARSAVADLQALVDYHADADCADAGRKLVSELLKSAARLSDFPDSGRVVPEFEAPFLREVIHPPFRIVYRRETDAIRIVRVWRSERLLRLDD